MPGSESSNNRVTTHQLLVEGARTGLDLQRDDGWFPPGRNYTYDEPETPVRTTSHWVRTLTKAYEITGDSEFARAANDAIDYLLTDGVRPHGYTYHCRTVQSKDKCNGLVGQAAPIKALAYASEVFDRPDARDQAEEVFLLHPFNDEVGLWERVEIDGQKLSFDRTLNHQCIFAAASSLLIPELDQAEQRIERFLDELQSNMHTHENGLIKHYVRPPISSVLKTVLRSPRRYDMLINEIAFHYYSHSDERRKKERGYQTINLYALSELAESFPEHDFWESDVLMRSLDFLRRNERDLANGVDTKHGDPLPGIGIAKIRHRFEGQPIDEFGHLIREEIKLNDGSSPGIFEIENVDGSTQTALISTLVNIPNTEIIE